MYIIGIFLFLLIIVIIRMYTNKSNKSNKSCENASVKKKKEKHKKKQIKDAYEEPSKEINIQEKINSSSDRSEKNKWNLSNAIRMFNEKQNAYIKKMNIVI